MMHNPYSWNTVNPEQCYGRDGILNELLSGLGGNPRYFFGLAGARRMGKSTLLRRLEQDLQASVEQSRQDGLLVLPIYIDGLEFPRPLTAADVWATLLNKLQTALPNQPLQSSEPLDFSGFKSFIKPVLMNLSEQARIIVMFDEIEPITVCEWGNGFLAHWRALLTNTPDLSQYFTAVFAGAREMANLREDITSPLADILEWHNLHALAVEDARRLMEEPINHKWSERFVQEVYEETGAHPMLLQYVMEKICAEPLDKAEESFKKAVARFGRERRWQFNEWWDRYCTPTAQRIYARLPDDGNWLPLRQLTREFGIRNTNNAIEILQHIGLVATDEDELAFRYSGEIFRRWYRTYGILAESAMHDPEIHARLTKFDSQLADKYLTAWQIYQADLPNYSGAVGEIRDVLTLLLNQIAPKEVVMAQPNFKLEANTNQPTRRQRVRYAARQRYSKKYAKEIVSNFDLLETACEQLAQVVTKAYGGASGLTHTTATREQAYRALKQWDSILVQLVPIDSTSDK